MIQGKIYRLNFNDDTCYVGSTIKKYLSQRVGQHKQNPSSKNGYTPIATEKINSGIGFTQEILKEDLFFNTDDLLYWERIFTELTPNTLNKRRCWRTTEEIKKTKSVRDKRFREKNKDKINEKKSQRFICECGKEYQHSNKARHIRSKFHQNFIINLK